MLHTQVERNRVQKHALALEDIRVRVRVRVGVGVRARALLALPPPRAYLPRVARARARVWVGVRVRALLTYLPRVDAHEEQLALEHLGLPRRDVHLGRATAGVRARARGTARVRGSF